MAAQLDGARPPEGSPHLGVLEIFDDKIRACPAKGLRGLPGRDADREKPSASRRLDARDRVSRF